MTYSPPLPSPTHDVRNLSIGSWNINSRSGSIVLRHLAFLRQTGVDVVALQEVTEPYYRALAEALGELNVAYSLALQPPEPGAPRNRRLGCAVAVLNPALAIGKAHLLQTTVCPERTIVATLTLNGLPFRIGSFHSPNGSNWGSNKALWFNDITNWANQQMEPTTFGIDANTPRRAELPDTDPKKWWREDSHPQVGNAAQRLVGDEPSHSLRDAWKAANPNAAFTPISYYRGHKTDRAELASRYDFIYTSHHFRPTACHYYYDEVIQAPQPLSDHALVVAQLRLEQPSRVEPVPTKEVVSMPHPTTQATAQPPKAARTQRDAGSVPDEAAYEVAFRELLSGGNNSYRRMLEANLSAPGHAMTPQELAHAAGYAHYSTVNLQYGTLGARLGRLLNYKPTKLSLQGKECHTFTFADWEAGKWVLRRDVVAALTKLGLGH